MPVQISRAIEQDQELAAHARRANQVVEPLLRRHSQTATGLWDLTHKSPDHAILNLAISDPWGSASLDFEVSELENDHLVERRVHDMIGEMISPSPKVRIDIRDSFVGTDQLETLRRELGLLGLTDSGFKLHNQVRFVPSRPDQFLLTDFAVDVNTNLEQAVRQVIVNSGFQLREEKALLSLPDVKESLKKLVAKHRMEGSAIPSHAVCFRVHELESVHLLEVSDQMDKMEDGSLDGIGFNPGRSIPEARTLVLYLIHPEDLKLAHREQPDHPLIRDLRSGQCVFIYPDDEGRSFRQSFPDLFEG